MSGFFSANVTSPFPDQNALFDAAKVANAGQAYQSNQLGLQGQQMQLTAADHEQVGRLAAGLLNIKDPAARAQAYAQGVGVLQSQGLAKYAPPTLPDEQSLQMLVSQTVPVQDQYKMGIISPPGLTEALARASAPPPGYGGTGVATTPSATIEPAAFNNATAVRDGLIKRGIDADTATALAANALHESVANPRTGRGDNGNSAGLFQWAGPRLQAYTDTYGHSPDGSPLDEQLDNVVRELKGSEAPAAAKIAEAQGPAAKAAAVSQYYLRPKDTVPEMQRRSATALQLQQQIGGGATTASTAPTTAQPGQPVPTQVAGPPMVSTAPGGPAQPAAPTAAPAQPGQPQPAPAPAATAQPGATPLPGTGVNSQQFQTALWKTQQAALLETQFPNSPAAKAKAAELRAEAALYMQADSVITLPNGIQVKALSGQQLDAAKPLADYRETTPGSGIWVGGPGTEPKFQPPGRLVVTPGGDVYQTTTGGAKLLKPTDTAAVTALEAAKTSGAAAGTATGKLTATLADQGRSSAQAIGNIDYGLSQLEKAKAGGINTGYFAPWLSTIGAVAKSLGVPPELIGVDPSAVGNIQTAQKTLAVVSGAILQQVLGPDSQITDAKLQHFIHAQPGIETDPEAVSRVLNWARSQFVYEREMSAQGMKDASTTGVLPTNWQANYYDKHGFAPIYNPGTGEMQQPDGSAPPRQAPATLTTAPINPAARTTGTVYRTPKGPMKWTGTGWLPVQ